MGRTGSLRDYMADIARSNAEGGSGGGETIDINYFYDKSNVDEITLLGVSDKQRVIENFTIDSGTSEIHPTLQVDSYDDIQITYKNGLKFGDSVRGNNATPVRTLEYNELDFGGGYRISFNTLLNTITCFYNQLGGSGTELWQISIV